jgi:hypothetical protein
MLQLKQFSDRDVLRRCARLSRRKSQAVPAAVGPRLQQLLLPRPRVSHPRTGKKLFQCFTQVWDKYLHAMLIQYISLEWFTLCLVKVLSVSYLGYLQCCNVKSKHS